MQPGLRSLFGAPPEQLIGASVGQIFPLEMSNLISKPDSYELNAHRPDGGQFPAHISIAEFSRDGRRMFTVNVHDLTATRQAEDERRLLQSRVQHVQKLESLGVLAGGVAHDFNNLLVAVMGHAELLGDMVPPGSLQAQSVSAINSAANRAADLCRQMLAYSGQGRFVVRAFRLEDIVRETAAILQTSLPATTRMHFHFEPNVPAIEGDIGQIRQVTTNLLSNAADAIGERGGTIDVRTGVMDVDRAWLQSTFVYSEQPEGRYVFVEVRDDGCGMDAASRAKMFDPFYSTKGTGRGLGLSAVLGIIRGHQGAIRVDSELGKGTTIRMIFPEARIPVEPLPPQQSTPTPWHGEGLVLIIDDEKDVVHNVKQVLEAAHFKTLIALGGRQGIELFQEHRDALRLVILDLMMPDLDGAEVCREIQRIRPGMPLLLFSTFDENETSARFPGLAPAGILHKPFTSSELRDRVRDAMLKVRT